MNKGLYAKTCFGLPVGILLFLLWGKNAFPSLSEFLVVTVGGYADTQSSTLSITTILLFAFPFLVQLALFFNIMEEELERTAVFLFTRSYSMKKWFFKKFMHIMAVSFLFSLQMGIGVTLCCFCFGVPIGDLSVLWRMLVGICLCTFLCQATFLWVCNVVSVWVPSKVTVLVMWLIYVLAPVLYYLFGKWNPPAWLAWYPSMQAVFNLHENGVLAESFPYLFNIAIPGFSILFSLGYNGVILLVSAIAGHLGLKRYNVL